MSRQAYAPLSAQELSRSAEMFEWRPQIPLKYHIGSLDAMYREGLTYYEEHNYAKAYVLLMRYSIICVDKIPTHPEANTPEARRLIRTATRRLSKTVLPLLESIKQDLDESRRKWERRAAAAKAKGATSPSARKAVPAGPRQPPPSTYLSYGTQSAVQADFAERDPALSWNAHSQPELLDASENVSLAVELANRRRAGRDKASSPVQRRAVPSHSNQTHSNQTDDDVRIGMESVRWQLEEMERYESYGSRSRDAREPPNPVPVSYNYPSVRQSNPVQYEAMRFDDSRRDPKTERDVPRPSLPPKRPTFDPPSAAIPPPVPSRGEAYTSRYDNDLSSLQLSGLSSALPSVPALPPKEAAPPSAPPSPPPKKSSYTFKPKAYLENGTPIRGVFLPDTLRGEFLKIAQPNTARGIETCGILCGKTVNNALFITCLLIPQQIGTADSCETTEEVETFEYCSAEDLIQIGWIHTHPTQTCFMSSLDMHTHAGYQMMMDESIAIVCAPKFEPSWGVFRLTNPPGLPYIVGCRKAGAFHEHDLRPHEIYREALSPPGHVIVAAGIDYKVKDLRTKGTSTF